MAAKLKVLVAGGDERTITQEMKDRLDVIHDPKMGNRLAAPGSEIDAVVVVAKFISHSKQTVAKKIAAQRGVPLVLAKGPNYVIYELERRGLLKPEPVEVVNGTTEEPAWKKEPWARGVVVGPDQDGTELPRPVVDDEDRPPSVDSAWALVANAVRTWIGKDKASNVEATLVKIDEALEAAHITTAQTPAQILERAVKEGVLFERFHGGSVRYGTEPQKHAQFAVDAAVLVAGLPRGPYAMLNLVGTRMGEYAEFRNKDGSKYSDAWYGYVLRAAQDLGVVKKTGEEYVVEQDETVKLHVALASTGKATTEKPEEHKPGVVEVSVVVGVEAWNRLAAVSFAASFDVTVDAALRMRAAGVVTDDVWADHAREEVQRRVTEFSEEPEA